MTSPDDAVIDAPPADDYLAGVLKDVAATFEPPAPEPAAVVESPAPVVEPPTPVDTPEPAATDDIDEIKPPENASAATREHWDKIKETSRNYKAKAAAAEALLETERQEAAAKLSEYEAKLAEVAEIRARAEKYDEAEKELAVSRVESSEQFKNAIIKPLEAIFSKAEQLARDNELSPSDVFDAIREPDPAKQRAMLKDLIPQLDDLDRTKFLRMVEDASGIYAKEDEIRANALAAKKEMEERAQQETTKAREASAKEFQSAAEHSAAELKKRLPFVELEPGETADGVFALMLKKAKETDFDAAPQSVKATAALSTIALERAIKQNQKLMDEVKTLKARVAEDSKSSPAIDPALPVVEQPSAGDTVSRIEDFLKVPRSRNVLDDIAAGLAASGGR